MFPFGFQFGINISHLQKSPYAPHKKLRADYSSSENLVLNVQTSCRTDVLKRFDLLVVSLGKFLHQFELLSDSLGGSRTNVSSILK